MHSSAIRLIVLMEILKHDSEPLHSEVPCSHRNLHHFSDTDCGTFAPFASFLLLFFHSPHLSASHLNFGVQGPAGSCQSRATFPCSVTQKLIINDKGFGPLPYL